MEHKNFEKGCGGDELAPVDRSKSLDKSCQNGDTKRRERQGSQHLHEAQLSSQHKSPRATIHTARQQRSAKAISGNVPPNGYPSHCTLLGVRAITTNKDVFKSMSPKQPSLDQGPSSCRREAVQEGRLA